jgi:serine/threonine protein kinase
MDWKSGMRDHAPDRKDAGDPERDPFAGTRLGSYHLIDELGSGGMCAVYRARHVELGTEFAVKVLHPGRTPQEIFTQRLRREAAAGLRLNHPNVVKIVELGMGPRGPFLVMELLRGSTLHALLARHGALAPLPAAKIVRQVADGLGAAHRAGFVHRDLKPGNIMLVPSAIGEVVKILDLGIVGVTSGDPNEQLTRDNLVVGTPAYMAPEQFHGSSTVGPQADLYSLGVVLYQTLRGRPPFEGGFQEIIAQHMMTPPDPLPESEGLEELAYWLLEKNAAKRPQHAAEVIAFVDRNFPNCTNASVEQGARPLSDVPPVAIPPLPSVQAEEWRADPLEGIGRIEVKSDPSVEQPVLRVLGAETALEEAPDEEPQLQVLTSDEGGGDRESLPNPTQLEPVPIPWPLGMEVSPRSISPPSGGSLSALRRRSRSRFGSRFKPARRLAWPLRFAIPLVWSIALVGGAFAAQRLLLKQGSPSLSVAHVTRNSPAALAIRTAAEEEGRAVAQVRIERTTDAQIVTAPRAASSAPLPDRAQRDGRSAARALEGKLRKIAHHLERFAKEKRLTRAELAAFEDWYLDLAEASQPGLADGDARLLGSRADMLLSRLNRLAKLKK